jgi:hypothetical protein
MERKCEGEIGMRGGEREREGREEVCVSEVMQEEMKGCNEDSFQWLTLSGDSLSDLFVFEKSLPAYCLFIFWDRAEKRWGRELSEDKGIERGRKGGRWIDWLLCSEGTERGQRGREKGREGGRKGLGRARRGMGQGGTREGSSKGQRGRGEGGTYGTLSSGAMRVSAVTISNIPEASERDLDRAMRNWGEKRGEGEGAGGRWRDDGGRRKI